MSYRPDPRILTLGPDFYDRVDRATFPNCIPRFINDRWAARVGLAFDQTDWAKHFCRFTVLPDNLGSPIALRYHGHQFRVYNPEIGDGRGFTMAQLRDDKDRLLDLGTKGSGQTPYSRFGDGRLTLKGGVREVLATEMLEALGVNTSKSFALFETGEALERGDEPSPTRSSVLTRLSHGHIRIGSFQRLAFYGQIENLKKLTRYCLENLYSDAASGDDQENAETLFDRVSSSTASLAASYLSAGFVHGVLNSDNINITGESFDYGPWRFTPHFDATFTAAYFDHYGLYAFGRQPEAIHWNLAQLAGCLSLFAEARPLGDMLARWNERFEDAMVGSLLTRLGITRRGDDREITGALIRALKAGPHTIDQIFFDWRGGHDPGPESYPEEPFRKLAQLLAGREQPLFHLYWSDRAPCSMHIDEVESIWEAIAQSDDWQPFNNKVKAIRRMGDAMGQDAPRG
ncbi:MAG TPA: YdiU family protein [Sphingomicrobium sp.]|nr:YdiU family protein [Sphingomicrobium sp.]